MHVHFGNLPAGTSKYCCATHDEYAIVTFDSRPVGDATLIKMLDHTGTVIYTHYMRNT